MLNFLKENRKRQGFTQQQIADVLGISREKYNKIELSKAEPTFREADMLACYFGYTVYELFPGMVSGEFYLSELRKSRDEGIEIAKNAIYQTASALV